MTDARATSMYEATCGAFAELVAHGVRTAVISPGSRSTPLTVAAGWTEGLDVVVHLDERSAGFHALGMAKAQRAPVVLVCTSGTAAANYLPAVIEAHYTGIPLLVFTADRPPELRDWGAGQTIDQVELFGSHIRWAADLAVAGEVEPSWFRRMAARAIAAASAPNPGPVHLNWPFREPLEPDGRPTVDRRPTVAMSLDRSSPRSSDIDVVSELVALERGLIVAGPATFDDDEVRAIGEFSRRTGWPLVAEPGSQLRFGPHVETTAVISTVDQLCRVRHWTEDHLPDVVVRIGDSPTCKPLRQWLEADPPLHHVMVDPDDRWNEASFTATARVTSAAAGLFDAVDVDRGSTAWTRAWADADARAAEAIEGVLGEGPLLEALIARTLCASMTSESALYVSNSMPVRDIDGFAASSGDGPTVYSNRGASGIDGLISCADGVASTGTPTVLHIGDVALLHDAGGLLHAARHGHELTLVVPNNDGGGIFSFLPVANVAGVGFEELFHTAHGTDLSGFGGFGGIRHHRVDSVDQLVKTLDDCVHRSGVDIVEIPVDREANLAQHRAVSAAVAVALT